MHAFPFTVILRDSLLCVAAVVVCWRGSSTSVETHNTPRVPGPAQHMVGLRKKGIHVARLGEMQDSVRLT